MNKNLHAAKKAKNDEFYTQLSDIEKELQHYVKHFKNKVVLCNCDDPEESNFWRYFSMNFEYLGLKKLISTHFNATAPSYKLELCADINADGRVNHLDTIKTPLKQNGDFRSPECIDIMNEADIIVTNPPFSCYSFDTEVLTNNGWKLFKNVIDNDLICSLNLENNCIEYVGIKEKLKYFVDDKLLHFESRNMDLLVTENHRMIARKKDGKTPIQTIEDKESLIRADKVKSFYTVPLRGFDYHGQNNSIFVLPGIEQKEQYTRKEISLNSKSIDMGDWLEFFGMWLADGCCRRGKNSQGNQRYTVSIKQNEKNGEYIKELFKRIGFECRIELNKTGNHNYTVYSKQLWSYLEQFSKSHDKFIPKDILMLNRNLLSRLWLGYIKGDSHGDENLFYLGTVSKQLAKDLAEVCLKVEGRIINFTPKKVIYKNKPYEYYQATYSKLNLSRQNAKYPKPKITKYNDYVYCLELERNGTMLVRRNYRACWSGNCFREYISQLVEYDKKFLVIGNKNAITYKEIFRLIKDNRLWEGLTSPNEFGIPGGEITKSVNGLCRWFTNLSHKKRREKLILYKEYNPTDYPKYDNYWAWEVNKVNNIPINNEIEVIITEQELEELKKTDYEFEIIDTII